MRPKPIPDGYEGATPYLCCSDAAAAIEFYKQAFGATVSMRFADAKDKIGHAELRIGAAAVMLSDEFADMEVRSPQSLGGTPVTIHLYVDDVDRLVPQAVAAGATVLRPLSDQFYGDRSAKLRDPFGHQWILATHKQDVSEEEMRRRSAAMFGQS